MITAKEAKVTTMIIRAQQKEEKINKVIAWCESREKDILNSVQEGTWCIHTTLPYGYANHLLNYEECCQIIKEYFESYDYEVKYDSVRDKFTISWYV